jgi:AcrR family transcriptional regulator
MPRAKDDSKIDALYQATLALVMHTGYTELKMADVAKQAGMATGTLYIYFKNKEELINRLFIKLKEEKVQEMFSQYDAKDTLFLSLRKIWYAYFEASNRDFHKMLFIEQYTYSPYLSEETRKKSDALLKPMIDLFKKAQEEHVIKEIQPEIMMSHIIGSTLEIIKFSKNTASKLSNKQIDQCFEMIWNSIRK